MASLSSSSIINTFVSPSHELDNFSLMWDIPPLSPGQSNSDLTDVEVEIDSQLETSFLPVVHASLNLKTEVSVKTEVGTTPPLQGRIAAIPTTSQLDTDNSEPDAAPQIFLPPEPLPHPSSIPASLCASLPPAFYDFIASNTIKPSLPMMHPIVSSTSSSSAPIFCAIPSPSLTTTPAKKKRAYIRRTPLKSRVTDKVDIKDEDRKLKNRLAGQRYRQKNKNRLNELREKVETVLKENAKLKSAIKDLSTKHTTS